MSAAFESVLRGDADLVKVTSLEGAVRAWLALNAEHRGVAILTPERPVVINGSSMDELTGEGIVALAERLQGSAAATSDSADDTALGRARYGVG